MRHIREIEEEELYLASNEVEQFIIDNSLCGFLNGAFESLKKIFGNELKTGLYIWSDPAGGDPFLSINILVDSYESEDKKFTKWCHQWWYDRIDQWGHKVMFRIILDH